MDYHTKAGTKRGKCSLTKGISRCELEYRMRKENRRLEYMVAALNVYDELENLPVSTSVYTNGLRSW